MNQRQTQSQLGSSQISIPGEVSNRYQVRNPHSGKLIRQTYSTSAHASHWVPQRVAATHRYVTVTKGRGWASGAAGGCTAGLGAKSDSRHRQASQKHNPVGRGTGQLS
jgi:hypothetical protein